jgi:trehalose utilization protein
MRALVLCGDQWHPAAVAREGLSGLADICQFDWIEDAGEWSAERMAAYPLVVLTKANQASESDHGPWATDAVAAAFEGYVRGGGGLLVVHSGAAGYHAVPALRGLMGGAFVAHPPQCPVTVEPQPDHPLAAGSAAFTLRDEHYEMALDDDGADRFVTTRSEHGAQPGGWTRREGRGRVCVLTPGHNLEVWLHPAYQALLRNALHWCGAS